MALGVLILGINGIGERSDSIENGLRKRSGAIRERGGGRFGRRQGFCELAKALVDFVEGIGAGGEKALKGDAEIGFEDIALPPACFFGVHVIGGGNGVAALMLGKIHRSVGDLDELLRRRAVEWIASDTEAGGDVLLAKKR